ncbi:MAG: SAM-dependent DNA methyltransferase [Nitrososphaerota archaeon]|nr:SAM-dependent DNA methyltransferase [Nitrososphaerota archaeon]
MNAQFEENFLTSFGTSKPDIYISFNNQNYFVEAKQRPRKLVDAVSKAYTYLKKLSSISPRAVFATVYPQDCVGDCESAVLLNQPPFYAAYTATSLQQLAQWITQQITNPPAPTEINTSDAIRLLRDAVAGLAASFARLETKDVEEIFGGRIFFETILGVKEEDQIPLSHLRHAASYLLVNQILFYQILAKEKQGTIRYDEIDTENLIAPKQLQEIYFAKVLLEDYKPIFGFDIASKLHQPESLEAVKVTIDAVNALSPQSLGHDVLGKIFHNLIPLDLRKVIAAFYTNVQAGEILATLAIDDPDSTVIDPACGSGTLLVSSYQRKKALVESSTGEFEFADHKRFLEQQLTGIDVMPFAAHLAAVHLSLQAPLYTTDFIRVAIQDSTKLKPGDEISSANVVLKEAFEQSKLTDDFTKPSEDKRKTARGLVDLGRTSERSIELSKVSLVIMNPPFTRYQNIPTQYKAALAKRFDTSRYRNCVSGQLGLHGYFLLLADRFLEDNGRLAAVLPITTLNAKGTLPFIDILLNDYSLEYIIACEGRSAFSENVAVREVLLIAKKFKSSTNHVAIVILKDSPDILSISQSRSIANDLKQLRLRKTDRIIDSKNFQFKMIAQNDAIKDKLSLFRSISIYRKDISELALRITQILANAPHNISFGDYLRNVKAEIHESPRGIEGFGYYGLSIVNHVDRALKKHDVWFVKSKSHDQLTVENRFSHITFPIPRDSLAPSIRRYSGLSKFNITSRADFVIVKPFDNVQQFLEAGFITSKQKQKATRGLQSGNWKDFVSEHSSNIALIYRARITNTSHLAFYSSTPIFMGGSFWMINIPNSRQAKLLCLWLNSSLNLFQWFVDRKETEGAWMWIDQYIMENFLLPDFLKISEKDAEKLSELFDDFGKQDFPTLLEQLRERNKMRMKIDSAFLALMGVEKDEIPQILIDLYSILSNELGKLGNVLHEQKSPD